MYIRTHVCALGALTYVHAIVCTCTCVFGAYVCMSCHTMREHGVIMGYCVPEEPTCVVTVHD